MNIVWSVAQDASGTLLVRTRGPQGRSPERRACTVGQACKMMKRSRRHVYRYMKDGVLKPHGKFLGDWLLDPEEVRRIAALPAGLKRPPRRSRALFPEYSLSKLNPYRDRALILARMLEGGDRREAAWALKRYPKEEIRNFLERDGPRVLSAKPLRFWSLYFGMKAPKPPAWRRLGRRWGGAGA